MIKRRNNFEQDRISLLPVSLQLNCKTKILNEEIRIETTGTIGVVYNT